VLVDGGGDDPFLEVGGHFGEEVGGDEFYLAFETAGAQSAADGEAVHGVDVQAVERGEAEKKVGSFLEAFVFVFMAFDDADDFAFGAVAEKTFGETVGFFAVVFGGEHSGDYGYLRAGRDALAHEFSGEAAVQAGLDAYDAGAAAFGGVGGDADDAYAFFFGIVDERC